MDSTDILKSALKNERELFLNNLSSYTILDIGTIVEVKNGRALVHGSSFIGGQQTIYDDAEIVYPGNESGAYTVESAGTPCLIFIPLSCMPNIDNRNIQIRATSYDTDGVKVMPIGNGASSLVKTCFGAGGIFSILSKIYSLSFMEDAIHLERKDSATSLSMDTNGGLHLIRQGENGTHYIDDIDGSKTETWISKDKDVQWADTLNSDGSRTLVQSNPQDESSDPLFSMTIDAQGVVQINTAADINVVTKGNAKVEADGDVTVKAEQINLNGDEASLVTYDALDQAFNALGTGLMTALNNHVHSGGTIEGSTGIPASPMTLDLSAAEAKTLKTSSGS